MACESWEVPVLSKQQNHTHTRTHSLTEARGTDKTGGILSLVALSFDYLHPRCPVSLLPVVMVTPLISMRLSCHTRVGVSSAARAVLLTACAARPVLPALLLASAARAIHMKIPLFLLPPSWSLVSSLAESLEGRRESLKSNELDPDGAQQGTGGRQL